MLWNQLFSFMLRLEHIEWKSLVVHAMNFGDRDDAEMVAIEPANDTASEQ